MSSLRLVSTAVLIMSLTTAAVAQTANSATPSSSGSGANGVPQFPSAGSTTAGTAAPAGGSKIRAPTELERREQQKSDRTETICKGC